MLVLYLAYEMSHFNLENKQFAKSCPFLFCVPNRAELDYCICYIMKVRMQSTFVCLWCCSRHVLA